MAGHDESSPLLGSNALEPNQRIDDEEVQQVQSRDSPLYEGLPEVKKNLKWIVPAVAIGVSLFFLHMSHFDNVWTFLMHISNLFSLYIDIPLSCRSDHSSKCLRHNWQRLEGAEQDFMDFNSVRT